MFNLEHNHFLFLKEIVLLLQNFLNVTKAYYLTLHHVYMSPLSKLHCCLNDIYYMFLIKDRFSVDDIGHPLLISTVWRNLKVTKNQKQENSIRKKIWYLNFSLFILFSNICLLLIFFQYEIIFLRLYFFLNNQHIFTVHQMHEKSTRSELLGNS